MKPRLAIVFCVHHKPWLMMASLLTTLLQDLRRILAVMKDGAFHRPFPGRPGQARRDQAAA